MKITVAEKSEKKRLTFSMVKVGQVFRHRHDSYNWLKISDLGTFNCLRLENLLKGTCSEDAEVSDIFEIEEVVLKKIQ